MPEPTLDDLTQFQDLLYQAAFDDAGWAPAMSLMRGMLHGSSSLLAISFPDGGQRVLHGDGPPEFDARYFDPSLSNPFIPYFRPASDLLLFNDQSIMPRSEFHTSTFFNEWMAPQGAKYTGAGNTPVGNGLSAVFGTLRSGSAPDFDARDMQLIRRLAPTVARACMLRFRVGDLRENFDAESLDSIGIGRVVVDRASRVLSMNARTLDLAAEPDCGIGVLNGRFHAADWSQNNRMRAMIAAVCDPDRDVPSGGGDLLLRTINDGAPRLALTIAPYHGTAAYDLPVERAAVILVRDLAPLGKKAQERRYRNLFGLTKKEAELAVALAAGRSLRDHAYDRAVSIDTVRSHLGKLFAKTGCSRQGQLVALLGRAGSLSG